MLQHQPAVLQWEIMGTVPLYHVKNVGSAIGSANNCNHVAIYIEKSNNKNNNNNNSINLALHIDDTLVFL